MTKRLCNTAIAKSIASKYRAKRVTIDGHEFHSTKEGNRYCELKLLQLAGKITNLELQPKYKIFIGGKWICTYNGDFRYVENGKTVLEDVKSGPTKTPVYMLKKKLLKALHGIEIREV